MDILFWGLTTGTIGKLLLGLAVIRVHLIILREHKLDEVVFRSIKRERFITACGVLLIVIGYVLEMVFYGFTPLAPCGENVCAASLGAAFDAWR